MTKKFKVQVVWQMTGHYEIEADTLEEAEKLVKGPLLPLPEEQWYLDDSLEIDHECDSHGEIIEE